MNHLYINGQTIKLYDDQVAQLAAALNLTGSSEKLADIEVGDTCKLGAHEIIVLEQTGDTTAVILRDLLPPMEFGSTNNFDGSGVDATCAEFADEIATIIGAENIVEHTVDLTTDDGLKDYGKIERRCSLLTADLYRRFVEILDKFKPDRWWWLATAVSTKRHDNDSWVKCVAPSGFIDYDGHYNYGGGVRPFLILKSTISVSK